MADPRGLQINKDIFNFEAYIYHYSDKLPKSFRNSCLHQKLVEHVIEMRHYSYLACCTSKWERKEKVSLFSLAQGYAANVADALDHEYNAHWLTDKGKATMDTMLDGIRTGLAKLVSAMSKETSRLDARSTQ